LPDGDVDTAFSESRDELLIDRPRHELNVLQTRENGHRLVVGGGGACGRRLP
jgi:hypothetical protein